MAFLGGAATRIIHWLKRPGRSDHDVHEWQSVSAEEPASLDALGDPEDETEDEALDPEDEFLDPEDEFLDPEDAARDARTRTRMVACGLTPIRRITALESEANVVLRPRAEIVERLCGLTLAAAKARRIVEGESFAELAQLIDEQRVRHDPAWLFTGKERDFIDDPDPTRDQSVDFAWRLESALVMLWALNLIDALPEPGESRRPEQLLDSVRRCGDLPDRGLRPASELLDEKDFVFRCYFLAGMAYFRGEPVPNGLDLDVIEERRMALKWLTRDLRWRSPPHHYDRDEQGRLFLLNDGAVRSEWVIIPQDLGQEAGEDEAPRSLEQMIRKRRSEQLLSELGLPVYRWMPTTLDEHETRLWDWGTVLGRLAGVGIVAIKAADLMGGSAPAFVFNDLKDKVDRHDIDRTLSPKERAFINDPAPSARDIKQFVWRAESGRLLMWALGLEDEPLGPPYNQVDWDRFREIFWSSVEDRMVRPRSLSEILDEYDLTFRCYWPAQYFHLNGRAQPPGYDRDVLVERYHSLQWLLMGSDWDDWDDEALPESRRSSTLQ